MTTITRQILHDGERNAIVKAYITGTAVELTDGIVVDVSALDPVPTTVSISRLQASLVGMTATLEWDATADVAIMELPQDEDINQDFTRYGGLQNNAGAGVTGDIVATTIGAAVGTNGYIIAHVKKQ